MSTDVRSEWCKAMYCNFSSHECIRYNVEYLKLAEQQGDTLFAELLSYEIERWRAKISGGNTYDPYVKMVKFAVGLADTQPGSSDALIAAIATAKAACSASKSVFSFLEGFDHHYPSVGLSVRHTFFAKADQLLGDIAKLPKTMLAKAALARTKTALMNERLVEGKGNLKDLEADFQLIREYADDHVPAFFSRANNARRLREENKEILSQSQIISYFEETVQVAAQFSGIDVPLQEILGARKEIAKLVKPSSGLPLAIWELERIKAICILEDEDSKLSKIEVPQSSVLNTLRTELDEREKNRFDFMEI